MLVGNTLLVGWLWLAFPESDNGDADFVLLLDWESSNENDGDNFRFDEPDRCKGIARRRLSEKVISFELRCRQTMFGSFACLPLTRSPLTPFFRTVSFAHPPLPFVYLTSRFH